MNYEITQTQDEQVETFPDGLPQIDPEDVRRWEEEEAERRAAQWDAAPADMDVDVKSWVAQYRVRLHNTALSGRSRARDKEMLKTLCWLMEQQGQRTFVASRRELSEHSGLYPDAALKAVKSLRAAGFLRCLVFEKLTEKHYHVHRYALVMEKLETVAADAEVLPKTKIASLVSGDFSHDAFGGAKGMKGNRRAIYLWLLEHPRSTVYEIHKGMPTSYMTTSRTVAWLREQKLAIQQSDGRVSANEPKNGTDALDNVVVNNYLEGATKNRVEYCERDWYIIKAQRAAARKLTQALNYETRVTSPDELEFEHDCAL